MMHSMYVCKINCIIEYDARDVCVLNKVFFRV
jgi:hypothetical protein